MRWVVYMLMISGVLLASIACYYGLHLEDDPPPGQCLIVHETNRDIGNQHLGSSVDVPFKVENGGTQTLQVIGMGEV